MFNFLILIYFQLNILLNGNIVEELGTIVHVSKAVDLGRKMVLKLKDIIPRQIFQVITLITPFIFLTINRKN